MERFVRAPRAAEYFGMASAAITAIAIFVFGAPGWVLVPISMASASLFVHLDLRAQRRLDDHS
jgi:hypothetical protein